jgi:hypothetical protein
MNGITVELVTRWPVYRWRLPWPELHHRVVKVLKWTQRALDKGNKNLKYYSDNRESNAPSNHDRAGALLSTR